MASKHVDVLILGAGPTGLGAARRLHGQGHKEWLLLDGFNRPGGMAMTEEDDQGFLWDLGGHVIHSHFDAFNDAIGCHNDWVQPSRGGWVRVQDQWCPTPIQRHLGNLRNGAEISKELIELNEQRAADVASSSSAPAPTNLDEYYKSTFGQTLDKTFFSPFNFKQWAWPLTGLNHSWTSLRAGSKVANVPAPSSAVTASDRPADTSSFPYPRLGTGSLWQSVARHLPAERQSYNTVVVAIDLDAHSVKLQSGEVITYGHCISSLPLNRTIDLINAEKTQEDIPASLAPQLKHSSTTIVGLGFEGPLPKVLEGRTWIFGADADVSYHRATVLTNFSSSLSDGKQAPGQRWSIMFETSSSEHRKINTDCASLAETHLAELRRWGAITADQKPISTWYKHLVLGYPIPFSERDPLLLDDEANGILQRFERHGFLPRGRFGGWRYESSNQDYAFVQGVEAVDLLLTGAQETVYWPGRADKVVVPAPMESIASSSPTSSNAHLQKEHVAATQLSNASSAAQAIHA